MNCEKGKVKQGNICVSKKSEKIFGSVADEVNIIQLAFLGAIASMGGWAIFTGIVRVLNLENLSGWVLILAGFGISLGLYKFGLQRYAK